MLLLSLDDLHDDWHEALDQRDNVDFCYCHDFVSNYFSCDHFIVLLTTKQAIANLIDCDPLLSLALSQGLAQRSRLTEAVFGEAQHSARDDSDEISEGRSCPSPEI